jgi:hypothetical protein
MVSLNSSIERAEWLRFNYLFKDGKFPHQRFGQAFFNHFHLHKMVDVDGSLDRIYQADGMIASLLIKERFDLWS